MQPPEPQIRRLGDGQSLGGGPVVLDVTARGRPVFSYVREAPRKRADKETTLPPISGLLGTRGGCHRPSLTRVENIGQLPLSQETVVLGFLGCVEFPTISRTPMVCSFAAYFV
jgi:hypothetical protein